MVELPAGGLALNFARYAFVAATTPAGTLAHHWSVGSVGVLLPAT